jgi:hypothetical protein
VSELPQLERALNDAAHRRYGRAWWRPRASRTARGLVVAAALAAVAIAGAAVLSAVSDTAGPDERPATPPTDVWTTTVNTPHGFTVSVPPGWQLSAESLTPELLDPRELLSAATFPLAHRHGPCNHMPVGALSAMGPADGFVSVQERGGGRRASVAGFPPRPASFGASVEQRDGDIASCLGHTADTVEYWLPFRDAQRRFYALVVLGARAPERVKDEAFAILDRLRFDPTVQPDWKSSP